MADTFLIVPYKVRSAGTDVPPEEIQTAINSLAQQTTLALNSVSSDPTGPAGGDLSGNYPNPTVAAVHATSGTISGVAITSSSVAATTLTATTPLPVTSGGTGLNALTAHAVVLGEGSGNAAFASPGATTGVPLVSAGAAVDPAFGTASVAGGGTGRTTLTTHGVLVGEGTAAINQLAVGTTGQMLLGVTGADPAFGNNPTITGGSITGLASAIPVASGGTGAATLTAHGVLLGEGTTAIAATAVGTTGQMLVGVTGADPAFGNTVSTLTATGTITPNSTAGIVGTITNDNANAGSVGELISSTVLVGAAVALSTGVAANVTSINLTAGDWDVWGNVDFAVGGATVTTSIIATLGTVSATLPTQPNGGAFAFMNVTFTTGQAGCLPTGVMRLSLSATTTVYLIGQSSFSASTSSAYGFIGARRRR